MLRMMSLTLVLASCSSAASPASKPAAAALETLLPPGAELPPAIAGGRIAENVTAGSSIPASLPAGRDVPVYTRGQFALMAAGCEHEKGDIAAARDTALTRAQLSEAFALRLQAALSSAEQRASWLPWVIGGSALLGGIAAGLVIGAVVEANKRP
jgi:hypothetical protein